MAFKDANGRITIDETAAQKDIANIKAATEHLHNADTLLTQIIKTASEFSGETGKAVVETSSELQKQVRSLISYSEASTASIDRVVRKYEQIDRELKELINSYSQN